MAAAGQCISFRTKRVTFSGKNKAVFGQLTSQAECQTKNYTEQQPVASHLVKECSALYERHNVSTMFSRAHY